ncbi:hypothetical protein [Ferruginibacter profundus]
MSKEKKVTAKKVAAGTTILHTVTEQLNTSLQSLVAVLGEKKYKKRIKKAAKLLVEGIKEAAEKKAPVKKVIPVKKKAAKKAVLKKKK